MKTFSLALAALAALTASSVDASVIYSNGPINGSLLAVSGAIADSFTAPSGSVVDGATFGSLGFGPEEITWYLTSGNPFGGGSYTVLGTGTTSITPTFLGNSGFYNVYSDSISIPDVTLTGGNYFFLLQNGVDSGGALFLDINNGPSAAWWVGGSLTNFYIPGSDSNSFDILGTIGTGAPEPTTWLLMLAGFAGLGANLRSRRARPSVV